MNDRRLTDAQIASALRARLPADAPAGTRRNLLDAAEVTEQRATQDQAGEALSCLVPESLKIAGDDDLLFCNVLLSVCACVLAPRRRDLSSEAFVIKIN